MAVDPDRVATEESREAGPVHVGHQVWRQLDLEAILRGAGLSASACTLSEAMTLNRLICPLSEHAMPEWMHRTQTPLFLCVLASHLLVSIEKRFLDQGIHTSWGTLRQQLSTHQVVTVVLPTTEGKTLKIRKGTTPEPTHREIYATLGIPTGVMKPVKTWHETTTS